MATNTPTPTPTETPDETANWKTYTNSQYGYEVKYPNGWYYKDLGSIAKNIDNIVAFDEKEAVTYSSPINIAIEIKTYKDISENYGTDNKKTVTVAGQQGLRWEEGDPSGQVAINVLLPYKKTAIILYSKKEKAAEFEKILSTFKFLDSNQASSKEVKIPADWKQYSVTHPVYKWTTKISLPPGYKFESAGSGNWEAWVFNEKNSPDDSMDYRNSIYKDENSKSQNTYDGSSRREWYKKELKQRYNLEVQGAVEKTFGDKSYIEFKVKDGQRIFTHYLYVKDNVAHILIDSVEEQAVATSKLLNNVGLMFYSLSFSF